MLLPRCSVLFHRCSVHGNGLTAGRPTIFFGARLADDALKPVQLVAGEGGASECPVRVRMASEVDGLSVLSCPTHPIRVGRMDGPKEMHLGCRFDSSPLLGRVARIGTRASGAGPISCQVGL